MIQSVYIKNFKAWKKGVFKPFGSHTIIVGESESGKTSILEALDYFFNHTKLDGAAVIDPRHDVEIGVRIDGQNFRRIYDSHTLEAKLEVSDADWGIVDSLRYVYVPAAGKSPSRIAGELVAAKAVEGLGAEILELLRGCAEESARTLVGERASGESNVRIRILPARAVDVDLGSVAAVLEETAAGPGDAPDEDGLARGRKGREAIHGWRELYSILVSHSFPNVILGVDDAEKTVLYDSEAADVEALERSVCQLVMTTRSSGLLTQGNDTVVYTVGQAPGAGVAHTIGDAPALGNAFLFVEGQYDLPWYRRALELLGRTGRYAVLPGGGSNVDALIKEFRKLDLDCLLIRDGDMAEKSNPARDDYAIKRDCVEMYAPKRLLRDCFGVTPTRTKELFFEGIANSVETFDPAVRRNKSRFSPDDIKSIIADRIEEYLDGENPFVTEVGRILDDYEGRHG